jgi:hypothetical protein
MSPEATEYVLKHSPYKGTPRFIHFLMACVANEKKDYELWMTDQYLAERANCTREAVNRARRQMVEDGFLEPLSQDGAGRKARKYRFLFPKKSQWKDELCGESNRDISEHNCDISEDLTVTIPGPNCDMSKPNCDISGDQTVTCRDPDLLLHKREIEEDCKGNTNSPAAKSVNGTEEDFDLCWAQYPRKKERLGALKAYRATRKRGVSADNLLTATKNFAEYHRRRGTQQEYIKHGATFFGPNEPWRDYLAPPSIGEVPRANIRGCSPFEDALAAAERYIAKRQAQGAA